MFVNYPVLAPPVMIVFRCAGGLTKCSIGFFQVQCPHFYHDKENIDRIISKNLPQLSLNDYFFETSANCHIATLGYVIQIHQHGHNTGRFSASFATTVSTHVFDERMQ